MSPLISRLGILAMRFMAHWPLAWLRALGALLGYALYAVVWPRRHVVMVNLALCFPQLDAQALRGLARQNFVHFAQAWLDRSWLWHGNPETARRRLQLSGDLQALQGSNPVVIFAPHFVGLDAGWTALTLSLPRPLATIYTDQSNRVMNDWILRGRQRFGADSKLFGRVAGVRPVLDAVRRGGALYLLPDMNYGANESIFVPFYGVQAATVPSLHRFAKLGRAQVVPVLTRMTATGYDVQVLPAWASFPGADMTADTALMNLRLEGYIGAMPAQYYWVHKRFKTRPDGQPQVY